jgi:dihydrodipicolinate synthase/N-acetylneuraminate lyase
MLSFYKAIADACMLPVLAYNFPDLTGQSLSARLLLEMKKAIPNLAGVKDTIDSQAHIRDIVLTVKSVYPDFSVLVGQDEYLLGNLFVGGDGLIGSTTNFLPGVSIDLYQAFLNKDFDQVIDRHRKISKLSGISALSSPPVAAFKAAALALGHPGTDYVRPPLGRVSLEGLEKIKAILSEVTKK